MVGVARRIIGISESDTRSIDIVESVASDEMISVVDTVGGFDTANGGIS